MEYPSKSLWAKARATAKFLSYLYKLALFAILVLILGCLVEMNQMERAGVCSLLNTTYESFSECLTND